MKRRQTALERLQTGITGRTNIPLAADKQTAGPRGSNVAVKERGLSVVWGGAGSKGRQRSKTPLPCGVEGGERMGLVHPF